MRVRIQVPVALLEVVSFSVSGGEVKLSLSDGTVKLYGHILEIQPIYS